MHIPAWNVVHIQIPMYDLKQLCALWATCSYDDIYEYGDMELEQQEGIWSLLDVMFNPCSINQCSQASIR